MRGFAEPFRGLLKRSLFFLLLFHILWGGSSAFFAPLPLLQEQKAVQEESEALYLEDRNSAVKSIEIRDLGRHIFTLASSKFEGRGTGEEGGWLAAKYLANELQKYGCIPGGRDATYFQEYTVPKQKAPNEPMEMAKTANVLGFFRGIDPELQKEAVVLGAHYDHLGVKKKKIFPGADDNASGTSGVLEIAEAFSFCRYKPKRTLLFILFSGEEIGLKGSDHYTMNPRFPLSQTVAMVNLDMISRNKASEFFLCGVESCPVFKKIHEEANRLFRFKIQYTDQYLGRSDQYSFYKEKIPVLFFNTGLHGDYHRTGDTAKKASLTKAQRISQLVFLILWELVNLEERFEYTPIPEEALAGKLGIFPVETDEATEMELRLREQSGIVVRKIFPKTPAEKSSLKEGDVIVSIDGKKFPEEGAVGFFENFESNMKKSGTVKLEVFRGSKKLKIKVKV